MPKFFQLVSKQGNPIWTITIDFFLGICLFTPLPGWDSMMTFLTSLLALTYAIGPVCLLSLRYQLPDNPRVFKLPFVHIWSTVAFFICNCLIYFSGWAIISKMSLAILIGLGVLLFQHVLSRNEKSNSFNWRESLWLWPYLIGLTFISYIGDYGGGKNWLSLQEDVIVISVFSVVIMTLAVICRLPRETTQRYVQELHLEKEDEIHN